MRRGFGEAVGKRAGLVVVYLLATSVGRASVIDGDPMALVWPAGGLAVAWLITRPSKREWIVDIPLLIAVVVTASLVTGLGGVPTTVLAVSNVVAVMTVVLAVHWWSPSTVRRGAPPSTSPKAMLGFLAATAAGALLGVATGALGYELVGREVSLAGVIVWFGRNVCGMAAVGVTALLIVDRIRRGRRAQVVGGAWPELSLLFAATGALILVDYLSPLPVSFLLPAAAVWAGSLFASLPVAAHALAGGGGILLLTYAGEGPFSNVGDARTNILLAQLFIAMTLAIGLVLTATREARATLQAHVVAQEREQSQELRTFARRVAHDLRNPLSAVESWTAELAAELAANPVGRPDDTPTMIAGIERATARMRSLVDALLADAAARDRAPDHRVVDLPDLVTDVASEYDASGLVRTLGVRDVSGDPMLLRQLVDNLIGNALKYVRAGQPADITVSARRRADRVVVRVTDNGIGIPAGAHEWIFEPFRRAHEDAYPGTGLGLSTCRRIVERHGGSMRALPRDDGPGSVFEFDLPQARAARPQPALTEISA
jgi:signal transduction histidine kinase